MEHLFMPSFHHKNNVGPEQQLFIYPYPGLVTCPCRTCDMGGVFFKQQLCSRTAPLIFAANEKEIGQLKKIIGVDGYRC